MGKKLKQHMQTIKSFSYQKHKNDTKLFNEFQKIKTLKEKSFIVWKIFKTTATLHCQHKLMLTQ